MTISPISLSVPKTDFYFDNPSAAVDDIEYFMGLSKAVQALLDKITMDPGTDPVLKVQAASLSVECARVSTP